MDGPTTCGTSFPITQNLRLERLAQVRLRVPLSKSAIYERIKAGTFPKPIALGPKSCAWISTDIDAWIAQQIERQRAPEPRVA